MVERTYLNRDFIKVGVRNGPSKFIRVVVDLPKEVKHQLMRCLQSNIDLFTWYPKNIPNIDIHVAYHSSPKIVTWEDISRKWIDNPIVLHNLNIVWCPTYMHIK